MSAPSTGIVDSHAFMLALRSDAEAHGAHDRVPETPVLAGRAAERRAHHRKPAGSYPMRISAGIVVNAAGLGAQALARSIAGMPTPPRSPRCISQKGQLLCPQQTLSFLAPHLPDADARRSPAMHLTLDLGGQQAKFGPDVEYGSTQLTTRSIRRSLSVRSFYPAIRTYWPGPAGGAAALQPGYAGIRPQDRAAGRLDHGFPLLQTEEDLQRRGVDLNLNFGIEFAGANGEHGDCGLGGAPRLNNTGQLSRLASAVASKPKGGPAEDGATY